MFKMLMAIIEDHPAEYLDFIQPTVELAYFYGFSVDGNAIVFERFLIQLFNLTKLILICPQYKLPRTNGPICQMDGMLFYFNIFKIIMFSSFNKTAYLFSIINKYWYFKTVLIHTNGN